MAPPLSPTPGEAQRSWAVAVGGGLRQALRAGLRAAGIAGLRAPTAGPALEPFAGPGLRPPLPGYAGQGYARRYAPGVKVF